jgi:hypothetical protein
MSRLLQRGVDQELTPAAARSGQSLALQIGGRLDRRILANQNGLRFGIGAGACNGFDRRTGGIHGQESQFAGVADVERASVERFENRRSRGKLRPFDFVRKILRQSRNLEQGAIATLLIANTKRYGVSGQRRCGDRESQRRPEQRRTDTTEACAYFGFGLDCSHARYSLV